MDVEILLVKFADDISCEVVKWQVLTQTHPEQVGKGFTLNSMNFDSAKCNACNYGKGHSSNVGFGNIILAFIKTERLWGHDEINGKSPTIGQWDVIPKQVNKDTSTEKLSMPFDGERNSLCWKKNCLERSWFSIPWRF